MASYIDYDEFSFEVEQLGVAADGQRLFNVLQLLPLVVKEIDRLRDKVRRRDNKLKKLRCSFNDHKLQAKIQEQSATIRKQGKYIQRLKDENARLRIAKGFSTNNS